MRVASLLLLLISFSALSQNNQGLRFIQNKGQWNADIDFQARVPGGRVGVSPAGFSVLLLDMEGIEKQHLATHGTISEATGLPSTDPVNGHYFRINLLGSNAHANPIAGPALDGHYNYFLGNDTCRWAANALSFTSIRYPDIYNGIDLRVSSRGNNLKYDFIVKPGADPSQIRIQYSGTYGVSKSGDALEIKTAVGSLTEEKPFCYQLNSDNKQTAIKSEYRLKSDVVSFSFPDDYDRSRELVIDPLLIFSTYSGSTADNWGSTATPGEHGTLYSAGVTRQELGGFFPATEGAFQTSNRGGFDMAIIKYDSLGTKFLYATLLGGTNNDSPQSLVVDKASGDLIVLGISSSPNYPTASDAFDKTFNPGPTIFNRVLDSDDTWDIVITRLSPEGNALIGSTFIGGSDNDGLNRPKQSGGPLVANYGDEMRGDVITDESGFVYISSVTSSADFPIVNGFDNSFNGNTTTDGVVMKLTPDLSSIVWSTFVGGSGFDAVYSIKFDADNNIVVAGGTTSTDFPVTPGSYQTVFNGTVDGWIARLSGDGTTLINATFTGTSSFDQIYFVDLNANGDIFCYGQTAGHMPTTPGVYHNANTGQFLQKFSADLSALEFSTVFGSASASGLVIPNISPTAFLVNDCDNIYMAGWGGFVNSSEQTGFWKSTTLGMPVTDDAYQKTSSGSDFYFMVLNGDATELVYSTYLGGNSSRTHVDGGTSRFDKYGIVYHAVCSGCSFGNAEDHATSDFPTTPHAKSRINRSINCNNAAFKFDLSSLRAMFDTNNTTLSMPGFNNVCFPDSIVFQNLSTGGKTSTWDFGDGTVVTQQPTDPRFIVHQYRLPGQYQVKLTIYDPSTCSQTDATQKVINYFKDNIQVGEDGRICEGTGYQLTASGGIVYQWSDEGGAVISSNASPIVRPEQTTTYFVTVSDAHSCIRMDTVQVNVVDSVELKWNHTVNPSCTDLPSVFVQNLTAPEDGVTFQFDFGDGTTSTDAEVEHNYKADGWYVVILAAHKEFCIFDERVQVPIYRLVSPNVFTPEGSPGYNDRFEVLLGRDKTPPADVGLKVNLKVLDRWGKVFFESQDYKNDWTGAGLASGVYYYEVKVGDIAACKSWLQIMK
jgi:hypothetical protein